MPPFLASLSLCFMKFHITPCALNQLSLHYVSNMFDFLFVPFSFPASTTWDLTLLQFLDYFDNYVYFSRFSRMVAFA